MLEKQEINNSTGNEKKWFSEGSISSSVVNLCSATLGAGALSLPYALKLSGIVGGLGLLFLGALSTYFSIHLLIESSQKMELNSYESMGMHCFGSYMAYVIEACILVFCFGCATAYIIAVGDVLDQTILLLIVDMPFTVTRESLMVLFWAVIMFPLSLLQRMNALRYTSLIGTFSIFLLIFAIVFHSIDFLKNNKNNNDLQQNIKLWPDSFEDLLRACPIMFFAFSCQVNVFAIYSELSARSPSQMSSVTLYAVLICVLGYSLISIFAYLNFQQDTQEDVLKNYCLVDNPDIMMTIAFAFITLALTFSYPLSILPSRVTLHVISKRISSSILYINNDGKEVNNYNELETSADCNNLQEPLIEDVTEALVMENENENEAENTQELALARIPNFIYTFLISGSSLLIAIYTPDISTIFGLMGGSASTIICYVTPAMFYFYTHYTNNPQENETWKTLFKNICVGSFLIAGIVTGILGTVFTLISSNEENQDTKDVCADT